MKIRVSGMPEGIGCWENLFDSMEFLQALGFCVGLDEVVDFGCGYGTFTLPLARCVLGRVYAVGLEPEMLAVVRRRAAEQRLSNVVPLHRDLVQEGCGHGAASVGGVLLAQLLHGNAEQNVHLLQEAHRVLRPHESVAIMHWRSDVSTPRRPTLAFRPSRGQCAEWSIQAGFTQSSPELHLLGLYH